MRKNRKECYAVFVGRRIGIYRSWKETEKQVHGYRGAIYKGYENEEEAYRDLEEYVYNSNDDTAYGYDDDCLYIDTAEESYLQQGEETEHAAHTHYEAEAESVYAPLQALHTDESEDVAVARHSA